MERTENTEANANPSFQNYVGKRVHLIGICGSSMSGLALILQNMGCLVTGSNNLDCAKAEELRAHGIPVAIGHAAENVKGADLVVYTTAVPADHVELLACRELGIPALSRPELLGQLASLFSCTIAVCGTHGKTTTTSMISQILVENGRNPSVHIGGELTAIGGSIRVGSKDLFVTEACEYKKAFLSLYPKIEVILNIDRDHLDCYRDLQEIEETFGRFIDHTAGDGLIIGNGEDPGILRQLKHAPCRYETFGWHDSCDYYPEHYEEDSRGYASFDLMHKGTLLGHVDMAVPGAFNVENALAALAASYAIGADPASACSTISHFTGAKRRFEKTGTYNGAVYYHDYGHNPTEIHNAVSIARKHCPDGRIFVVLQPHTYSRVRTLLKEFGTCTREADLTLITDIFGAREADPGDVCSEMIVEEMQKNGVNAICTHSLGNTFQYLLKNVKKDDLVITLGCGNIYLLNDMITRYFQNHEEESSDPVS